MPLSQRPPSGASLQPSDVLYGQHSGTPRLAVLHLPFSSRGMDLGGFPNFCLPLPFLPLPVRCHLEGGGSGASSVCLRVEAEEADLQGSGSKWNTTLGSDSKDGSTEARLRHAQPCRSVGLEDLGHSDACIAGRWLNLQLAHQKIIEGG